MFDFTLVEKVDIYSNLQYSKKWPGFTIHSKMPRFNNWAKKGPVLQSSLKGSGFTI